MMSTEVEFTSCPAARLIPKNSPLLGEARNLCE
jgi:hypothetical protein